MTLYKFNRTTNNINAEKVMRINYRKECEADIDAIDTLTQLAFINVEHSTHTEHFIVRRLREASALSVSLVAETNGEIIGHVALSPVTISDGSVSWYGLGPISVRPDYQDKAIGSSLISEALSELKKLGANGCVLLGEPDFYSRFGFTANALIVLEGVPAAYFLQLTFSDKEPRGIVNYHSAFSATR
nr:N-acetyltransferase [Shewanella sp. GutDb-MelDb]